MQPRFLETREWNIAHAGHVTLLEQGWALLFLIQLKDSKEMLFVFYTVDYELC